MNLDLSSCIFKEKIRKLDLNGANIGGDSSYSFMGENNNSAQPFFALEIPYAKDNFYPDYINEAFGTEDFYEKLKIALNSGTDMVSVKFNADESSLEALCEEIPSIIAQIEAFSSKPMIYRGANNTEIDKILLPKIAESAKKQSIISFADETNYEEIVPPVVNAGHCLVLRTPIDINLAKELNILTIDKNLPPDRILIDPDMGGLGYGLEYGYSIVEKIKQAGFDGDTMLNMPIIAFIGEETCKAKEAKSEKFDENWGIYEERAAMWEISAASAMICAGVNLLVLWNPETIKTLKGLIK